MYPVIQIGSVTIPTYVLIISLIFSCGVFWLLQRAKLYSLDRAVALDLGLAIMLGSLVGARLLHVVYEEPAYYWSHPIEIIKIWQGGFVFYGGLIGAWVVGVFFIKRKNEDLWLWHDVFAPMVSLGYSIGRIACFLTGCCYGRATELFWGVRFPAGVPAPTGVKLHPTQLYATLWEFGVFLFLMWLEKSRRQRLPRGQLFAIWAMLHAVGRIIMEYFRIDHRGPGLFGLSISTIISLLFFVFGFVLFNRLNKIAKN